MAVKKVFQERLGDNGKRDKIQRVSVPNTIPFFVKILYLRKWGAPNQLRSMRLKRNYWDRPHNHLFSIFFDKQSQEV